MKNANVLIVGGSGFLGSKPRDVLSKQFEAVGTFNSSRNKSLVYLDITDQALVRKVVGEIEPDILINTASITDTDYCEVFQADAYRVNVKGTKNLIESFRGSKFIQISTDYVFDGEKGKYQEEDKPNPLNVYGETKLKAENIVQNFGGAI